MGAMAPLHAGMDWSQIAPDFYDDGSLRDIYILDASLDDWGSVWEVLLSTPGRLTFEIDGQASVPPIDIREVFLLKKTHGVSAHYKLGKQTINCNFFIEEEIELDISPRDVCGTIEAQCLSRFLAALGHATSREVRLTAENAQDAIIARYDPNTGNVLWQPAGP